MNFVAPLMLLGAIGCLVPIVVHLIGKRRAKVVPFAAMHFLLGSNRRLARSHQLAQILLLIARVLACLAVALIFAKPFVSCTEDRATATSGPQAAMLVLDNSLATLYLDGDETLLSRAKTQAHGLVRDLGPDADIGLVLARQGAFIAAKLSRDHAHLHDLIDNVSSTYKRADTQSALELAAQSISGSPHEKRTIYVISPLSVDGFASEKAWAPPLGISLIVVNTGRKVSRENVAVTQVVVERSDLGEHLQVRATVTNYGVSDVQERGIVLRVDGKAVARGTVSVAAGQTQEKQFVSPLANVGANRIVVELAADALPADDKRYEQVGADKQVRVLLVNGDPHNVRYRDELFYALPALTTAKKEEDVGEFVVKAITAEDLPQTELQDIEAIILANVPALSPEQGHRVLAWVEQGGGLLTTVGERVDVEAYNQSMAQLLPQRLQAVADVTYASQGVEREGRALRLEKLDTRHPVLDVFSDQDPALRDTLFDKIMLLDPTTEVGDRKIVARFTNGAAALIERRHQRGRLMLFASTLDRDWTDWPIQPGYLPMMRQLVRYLGGKHAVQEARSYAVGSSVAILQAGTVGVRVEVETPIEQLRVLSATESPDDRLLFTDTDVPGFYSVSATQRDRPKERWPHADFSINIDPRASNLQTVELASVTAEGDAMGLQQSSKRRKELWHVIGFALLLLLLVESILQLR